jgi:hypothetical protein
VRSTDRARSSLFVAAELATAGVTSGPAWSILGWAAVSGMSLLSLVKVKG